MTTPAQKSDIDPGERSRRYDSILAAAERELDARTLRRRILLAGGSALSLLAAVFISWLVGPLEKPSGSLITVVPLDDLISTEPAWLSDSLATGAWLDRGTAPVDWLIQTATTSELTWLATDDELDELMAQHTRIADRGILRVGTRTLLARDLDRDLARHAQQIQPDSPALPDSEPEEEPNAEPDAAPDTLPDPQ